LPTIRLPNNWRPRPDQLGLWGYLERGGTRAVEVAHRRWGKDDVALHWTAVSAHQRIGNYWHMLPEQKQARKAIWDAVNPRTGKRRIDEAFPEELRAGKSDSEMLIRFKCGSTWQVLGSDNFNSLVGSPPVGLVFSEYALAKPAAWDYLRPILAENGGWALFISTPRGRNHLYEIYEMAKTNPDWFAEVLPLTKTNALPPGTIDEERRSGMSEEMIEQEYGCSFAGVAAGYFYAREIDQLEKDGRIKPVPYDRALPVHTAWDLGYTDDTSIWFFQIHYGEIRLIDFYEANGHDVAHYCRVLQQKPYVYGNHFVPHDAEPATMAAPRSIMRQAYDLGIKMTVVPRLDVQDGIQAVRAILPRCWFDSEKTAPGLKALRQYGRKWDDERRSFGTVPVHNWASHAADAFRYLATGYREQAGDPIKPITTLADVTFNDLFAAPARGSAMPARI